MSEKIDARCTRDIVCPYCGHVFLDSWDCDEEGDIDCDVCGKRFTYYSERTMYYWSERNCAINSADHEWVVKFELHEGTMKVCKNCDQITFTRKGPDATPDLFPASVG